MKHLLLLSIACGALASCGGGKPYEFNKDKFDKGGYSFVVLSATNNIKTYSMAPDNEFVFKNENGKEAKMFVRGIKGFMIPSGDYHLTEYRLYGYKSSGNTVTIINTDMSSFAEASFSVAPGGAYYLGNNILHITKVFKNPKSNMFSRKTPQGENIDFTSVLKDDFAELSAETKEKFETQTGRKLEKNIMTWKDIDSHGSGKEDKKPLTDEERGIVR